MPYAVKTILSFLLILQASLISAEVKNNWKIDEKTSRILFISIKQSTIIEVFHFKKMNGHIDEDGRVLVEVDLASLDTGIPIRNSRMKKYLFETGRYSTASFVTSIDFAQIERMPVNSTQAIQSEISLALHGHKKSYSILLNVTKSEDQSLAVETIDPLIFDTGDFGLNNGVERLSQMAGLKAVNKKIPIVASLYFKKVH